MKPSYDFDMIPERMGTNSVKYDLIKKTGRPEDTIPLWVADMDFPSPPEVLQALQNRIEHGIFGYSFPDEKYFDAVRNWFLKRHNWNTRFDCFLITPGVMFAISAIIRAITEKDDGILICQPVYYPFYNTIVDNGRKVVVCELQEEDGRYFVDYVDFEEKIKQNDVKVFLLCSPHNPVGRVWTKEELKTMGDICLRNGVFVISDEIHADFIFGNHTHTVFPTIRQEYEDICAVCTSPSKTFNLAGLQLANIYIHNDEVRGKVKRELEKQSYTHPNVLAMVACQAAYMCGEKWLNDLLRYLEGNLRYLQTYVREKLPQVSIVEPQGTYLVWLDFRKCGLSDKQLKNMLINRSRIWLDDGYIFGPSASGFQRINIACPIATLQKALDRISLL